MRRTSLRPNTVTLLLTGINILLFFICEGMGGSTNTAVMLRMGAMVTPSAFSLAECWRLLASAFLHFGFGHLFNNMVALFVMGSFLEPRIGHIRFLILYLWGAVFGNLVSWQWYTHMNEVTISVGASGAISALLGAVAALALFRRNEMRGISLPRLILAVILVVLPGTNGGVDLAAHAGGLAGGFFLMPLLALTMPGNGRSVRR